MPRLDDIIGNNIRYILSPALAVYLGCSSLSPTAPAQTQRAEQDNTSRTEQELDNLLEDGTARKLYNKLPDEFKQNIPYELVRKIVKSAKPVAVNGIDISWMPFAKPDFNQDRKVDLEDLSLLFEKLGLKKGNARYDSRFDTDGDGYVGVNDFFRLVESFPLVQEGMNIELYPLLTPAGAIRVINPLLPGIIYPSADNVISSKIVNDSLYVDLDIPKELQGRRVEIDVVGYKGNDPKVGGREFIRVPRHYFNGTLNDGRAEWVMSDPLPPNVWLYVIVDPKTRYKASFNDEESISLSGGKRRKINGTIAFDTIDYTSSFLKIGNNFFRLRGEPTDGRVYRIILADTDKLSF